MVAHKNIKSLTVTDVLHYRNFTDWTEQWLQQKLHTSWISTKFKNFIFKRNKTPHKVNQSTDKETRKRQPVRETKLTVILVLNIFPYPTYLKILKSTVWDLLLLLFLVVTLVESLWSNYKCTLRKRGHTRNRQLSLDWPSAWVSTWHTML